MVDGNLKSQIEHHGQQHILPFLNALNTADQSRLVGQLDDVDWNLLEQYRSELNGASHRSQGEAAKVTPPTHVVRQPKSDAELDVWKKAREIGESTLRAGKVGAVLLAGGQGTRLGFAQPKGMYPIGCVSGNSLFQILAEQVVAISERFGHPIPYLVMTSEGTHHETIEFFESNAYFGLNRQDVFFFQQGYSPCLDAQTGQLLLADPGSLKMSPDGHGGLLAALLKAGMFDELRNRGVEYLFSHQVDNPLARACDPEFIGLHVHLGAEVSTKVVAKTGPGEKVGVAVDLNGRTAIVEYSDLSPELANQTDANGELQYWAGSTAIHVFNCHFLETIAKSTTSLPWHRALKKIPHIDSQGQSVHPETENGVKFERFLFDTLPMAKTALIVETLRAEEFAPLKNASGDYSPDFVRRQMIQVATSWLKSAGIDVPENASIEISPRFALSAVDLQARASDLVGLNFDQPINIGG